MAGLFSNHLVVLETRARDKTKTRAGAERVRALLETHGHEQAVELLAEVTGR